MLPQVGEKRRRGEEKEIFDAEDDRVDYFPFEDGDETEVPFEVNEVNFQTDANGIEYFLSSLLSKGTGNLTKHVMGQSGKPYPLTSIVKVTQTSSKDDDGDYDMTDKPNEEEFDEFTTPKVEDEFSANTKDWKWESDIYGLVSLIDITKSRNLDFAQEFARYLVANCSDQQKCQQMKNILNDCTGWIINEHVVNLPFTLCAMLQKNLFDEFKGEVQKKQISLFKYFILITKVYENIQDTGSSDPFDKDGGGKFEYKRKKSKSTPVFCKLEDEFFFRRSVLNYCIEMKNTHSYDESTPGLQNNVRFYKMVIVVERDKVNKIVKSLVKAAGGDNKMQID